MLASLSTSRENHGTDGFYALSPAVAAVRDAADDAKELTPTLPVSAFRTCHLPLHPLSRQPLRFAAER